ncbi:hypothetical protein BGZ83_004913 [Gryganskiella cystojenkinii]|nr:hypothetical protein BGZ83_004913 [Gryganskiella cystojenkinii]
MNILIPVCYSLFLPWMVQSMILSSKITWNQIMIGEKSLRQQQQLTVGVAGTGTGMMMMKIQLDGQIEKAGFLPATVEFLEPVLVRWQYPTQQGQQSRTLGRLVLIESLNVMGGQATITEETEFEVLDNDAISAFAKEMMTTESFVWSLSTIASVKILGMISVPRVEIKKDLTIPGMNMFPKTKVESFDLPGDSPPNSSNSTLGGGGGGGGGGGAHVQLVLSMNNPSPIGFKTLGSRLALDLFYQGTRLGQVTTTGNNTAFPGSHGSSSSSWSSSLLTLEGTLYRQSNLTDLDNLSSLMSNYLGGKISMITVKVGGIGGSINIRKRGDDASGSWLNGDLMKNLTFSIPLQPPMPVAVGVGAGGSPLNVLHDVQIADLGIIIHTSSPFNPTIESKTLSGTFKIPFNISIQMQSLQNTMALAVKGRLLGTLEKINSTTNSVSSSLGSFAFNLAPSKLAVTNEAQQQELMSFLADLAQKVEVPFSITGQSNATMNTAMGLLTLSDLPFNSELAIKGFNLNAGGAQGSDSVVLSNTVITGGTQDALIITTTVSFMNPSSLSIGIDGGNSGLQMIVLDRTTNQFLGELSPVTNMNLIPGLNLIPSQFLFHPTDPLARDLFVSQSLAGSSLGTPGSLSSLPSPSISVRIVGPGSTLAPSLSSSSSSHVIPELQKTLSQVMLSGSISGLTPSTLITAGQVTSTIANSTAGLDVAVPSNSNVVTTVTLQLHNPFSAELMVTSLTSQILWRGSLFGTISGTTASTTVPANSVGPSAALTILHPPGLDGLFMSSQFVSSNPGSSLESGSLVLFELENEVQIRIGGSNGYAAFVRYRQTINMQVKVNIASQLLPPPPPAMAVAPPPLSASVPTQALAASPVSSALKPVASPVVAPPLAPVPVPSAAPAPALVAPQLAPPSQPVPAPGPARASSSEFSKAPMLAKDRLPLSPPISPPVLS